MRTGNIRDAGRIFTRVNKTVENGIKSGVKTGTHKALQSRTDKSKITDTGAETINQALTEMRYTANAGKAVVNTSRTTVKAVTALRNMPRDTRIQVRAIKKTAEKTAKAAKYTASIIKRIIQSSTGKYLAVIIAVFIIVLLLISAFAGISSGIASSFSFLVDSEQDIYGVVTEYEEKIRNYVSKKQQEIQDIYDDFPCDRQNYGSNAEITEFRTSYFDIDKMQIDITTKERYAQIITMCAIQRYRQLDKNETLVNIKFTDDELCKMTDRFYKFEHGTRTDCCPHYDCCQYDEIMTSGDVNGTIYSNTVWYCDRYYHGCQEINEWVEKYSDSDEWDWDTIWSGERTFCDNPDHEYLTGRIENYSDAGIMYKLSFTDKEKKLYQDYYEILYALLKENQNV